MVHIDLQMFGGRGASSGKSEKGHLYGTDYRTILKSGNIKFLEKAREDAEELTETMTKGRIYVTLNTKNNPASIYYFNNELKRIKRIDITQSHLKMKPHTHHFEEQSYMNGNKGASKLTRKEIIMVERVINIWKNK